MNERKYMPTIAELIDRLSIITLKSIKLGCKNSEKKNAYEEEAELIMHDLNILLKDVTTLNNPGMFVRAIQVGMLANELIWSNEEQARKGGREQDHLLPFTHSINSIRMRAGNVIASQFDDRKDLNLDRYVDSISIERGYDFGGVI